MNPLDTSRRAAGAGTVAGAMSKAGRMVSALTKVGAAVVSSVRGKVAGNLTFAFNNLGASAQAVTPVTKVIGAADQAMAGEFLAAMQGNDPTSAMAGQFGGRRSMEKNALLKGGGGRI